jgi:hypothetical protein
MSGALVVLLSKGAQDVYISNDLATTYYRSMYTKMNSFSQSPQKLILSGTVSNDSQTILKLERRGDLISYIWLEGTNLVDNLSNTVFEFYIGGQLIDSQTYDYMADVWQIYMAENQSKKENINNAVSKSNSKFFPLHFYFCDNDMFLPLVAMQYYEAEIRIKWGGTIENVSNLEVYANYIYLDANERKMMTTKSMDFLITQVQRIPYSTPTQPLNIRYLNHPVKAIFFGFEASNVALASDYWTFDTLDMVLNHETYLSKMSSTYFHTVQGYYHTENGIIDFNETLGTPVYTRYFMYSFGNKVNRYDTSGTCNFSRIDSAKITFNNITIPAGKGITLYAVNYNVLRVRGGMAGILFSN